MRVAASRHFSSALRLPSDHTSSCLWASARAARPRSSLYSKSKASRDTNNIAEPGPLPPDRREQNSQGPPFPSLNTHSQRSPQPCLTSIPCLTQRPSLLNTGLTTPLPAPHGKPSWLPGPTARGYTSPFRFCAQPHLTPSVMAQNPVKPSLPPTAPSPHVLIHRPLLPPKALPKHQLPWIPPHPCSKTTVLCSLLSSWHILAP